MQIKKLKIKNVWLLSDMAWVYGVIGNYDEELKYLEKLRNLEEMIVGYMQSMEKFHYKLEQYEKGTRIFC